ncbi:hypothetical protein [Bradyrhizobium erythrophlei]|uniref:Uncharacterized protein n=1 Tax=Bradyrhizobium erythrophlei TaxID=1437360 RepID=A0A1M5NLX6_9BRAD|nr:hypothetical protein [Bradyrhizobium erythrophlei]SHG90584.1 hypothetical protein SAMN05443248_3048 [Bradyrhizobium erythrophlei]
MRSLIAGLFEGYGIGAAVSFAEHGYHWAAYAVGMAVVTFAYYDGRHGWSE